MNLFDLLFEPIVERIRRSGELGHRLGWSLSFEIQDHQIAHRRLLEPHCLPRQSKPLLLRFEFAAPRTVQLVAEGPPCRGLSRGDRCYKTLRCHLVHLPLRNEHSCHCSDRKLVPQRDGRFQPLTTPAVAHDAAAPAPATAASSYRYRETRRSRSRGLPTYPLTGEGWGEGETSSPKTLPQLSQNLC